MKVFFIFTSLLSIISVIEGLKVLSINPIGSTSHFAIGHSIVKTLLDAGHEITVISPYPLKNKLKNYTDIKAPNAIESFKKDGARFQFDSGKMHPMLRVKYLLMTIGTAMVKAYMTSPEILQFLESEQHFDVCIIEQFADEALFGFADRFDCVLITYTTFGVVKWINEITSNQSPYSYVPNPFSTFTDRMNFAERFSNTFYSLIESILYNFYHLPNQRMLYNKYFPNARKSFDEMFKSSSIIFMNSHVSASSPRPYLPNMIEIGGIHVQKAKPLPADIKEFLDNATEGAILFSMGSIIQAVDWPLERREAFVNAFGKLKQKVLWKYENETLPDNPGNIKIGSWIPQRDILAHPNVKLFITHGGMLGTTEAVSEGIPVLGLPIFGDQKMNMAKAVSRGYGLVVYYDDITEERISEALNELLTNPKYSKNAKEISGRFTDRPMTPQKSVLYWTEYAVRHKGAQHLHAAGNDLSYIELHLIDVYATFFAALLFYLYINYLILKFFFRKCISNGKVKTA